MALYTHTHDSIPQAILIVPNIQDFVETLEKKQKILVKQFYGGISVNTDNGVKEYVNDRGLKNRFNEYKKIFKLEQYFSWSLALLEFLVVIVIIAFLLFIIIAPIRVF